MKRLFVLATVLGLTIVLAGATFAQATTPDPGTGSVNFTIQNLDPSLDAKGQAEYVNASTGAVDATIPFTITSRGSQGFPADGSGLVDGWEGSVVASADREIVAFGQAIWQGGSSADGKTAGAYNAFTQGNAKLFLPSLAARQVQFSKISVQSAEPVNAAQTVAFTIAFYDRSGNPSGTITGSVMKGAQKTYNLSYETQGAGGVPDLPDDWLGSAVITADDGTSPLAVVATMHWREYAAAYSAVPSGGTKVSLPSVTRRIPTGTWLQYTGVVVQNLDATTTANVTVHWYDRAGNELVSFDDTVPANSAHGYNTRFVDTSDVPAAFHTTLPVSLTDDFNGSVVIESTNSVEIVAVANLQWTADHPAMAGASAYTSAAQGYAELFVPAAFRRVSGGSWIQSTGLIVQNIGTTACNNFQVQWFIRGNPTALMDYTDSLAPNISHGYNTKFAYPSSDFPSGEDPADLTDDFRGGVYIQATGCQLTAIHNTVWPSWTDNTTYIAFGK